METENNLSEKTSNSQFFNNKNNQVSQNFQNSQNNQEINIFEKPSRPRGFFNFFKNHKLSLSLFLVLAILIGGAFLGLSFYERYLHVISIEKILPANANIVTKVTINPDGEQFKLLESNLKKFPGYDLLKKELDKAGEGKTVSQVIQDKFKERGLDFQTDIKPVISEQAYIVIPNASPLGKNIQNDLLLSFDQKRPQALSALLENKDTAVLGESDAKKQSAQVDFIVASEIKNIKKAKDVLAKLQKDNRYEVTAKSDKGYAYYELKLKDASDSSSSYVNYIVTYHAMLGSNWVFTSSEDYMKQMIGLKKEQQFLSGLFSKNKIASLENDADFQKVDKELGDKSDSRLIEAYYKINFNDFFGDRDCVGSDCARVTDYIKYPENIISGFLVRVEPDGIVLTMDSNSVSLGDMQNVPTEKSLTRKIPQQIDGRWTDVFLEYNNLKELYYGFKKNNLTDKGLEEWNKSIYEIKNVVGIDIEANFIDLINGNSTFVLFTKKGNPSEGAAIFEISDPEKINNTMHKLIEAIKNFQIGIYSSYLNAEEDMANNFGTNSNPEYAKQVQAMQKKYQEALAKVENSAITETVLPEGKIYSYKIESPGDASFVPAFSVMLNYSLEDGKFIFSTDLDSLQSLLIGLKNVAQGVLAESTDYKTATRYYAPQMYADSYINTQGICNSVEYYFHKFFDTLYSAQAQFCDESNEDACQKQQDSMTEMKKKQDDGLFAFVSIARTLKLAGVYSVVSEKSIKTSWFLNIVEIPKEEKDRAESILEQL